MSAKVSCNGCGYTGGPDGTDWKVSSSAHTWGKCPKCGTSDLDIKVTCDTCGTLETATYGSMTRCLKCHPEPAQS